MRASGIDPVTRGGVWFAIVATVVGLALLAVVWFVLGLLLG